MNNNNLGLWGGANASETQELSTYSSLATCTGTGGSPIRLLFVLLLPADGWLSWVRSSRVARIDEEQQAPPSTEWPLGLETTGLAQRSSGNWDTLRCSARHCNAMHCAAQRCSIDQTCRQQQLDPEGFFDEGNNETNQVG